MTTLSSPDVGSLPQIQRPSRWVPCPLCRREWSKLHACPHWDPDQGKTVLTYACVTCAESVHALESVAAMKPCPGAEVSIHWHRGVSLPAEDLRKLPSTAYATVMFGKMAFSIHPQSGGAALKVVYGPESDKPYFADNVFQAWSYVSERIKRGEKIEPENEGWGKPLPFTGRRNKR